MRPRPKQRKPKPKYWWRVGVRSQDTGVDMLWLRVRAHKVHCVQVVHNDGGDSYMNGFQADHILVDVGGFNDIKVIQKERDL